ncbi:type 4a pilus biogenesis protein PilO [Allofrancisella guangzhouensis]|uniref:Type IV pili glycosylation protein n=1 Tax=Allofrancisella guangzhouensis TaxID=594679 RepID=A0A0A8E568_9GAMM|nr:type 4a pilus biogenesis protein PilO [Allofrancisella guangzhouensis]AJC49128.1 type IV pili glycosylation protein [Allofrancisella guangzhouensis]MBK2026845.1 type 4a pilus biogenesis protein PilO [Allofrancisella guangzhouensis]MBK2043595.1 type 4a pilus biogenesis protein PilO [Allofrancisella guangzhouensis]MBK2046342.1 type 4a pilus biogenesis protein PilO [Allofrancisella guangzhouensis]
MIDKLQFLLSSRYINKVIYAPLKLRLVVMLILLVLFSLVFYGMFVAPVLTNNASVESHINTMKDQIPLLIKKQKDLEKLKEQVEILEQSNSETKFSIPESHSVPIFLSSLSEAINSSGVTIIDLSPAGVEKNKHLDLYAINFRAKLSGSFPELIKLFIALFDMKDIAVITNMAIKREADEKLVIELNLQTYSRQGVGA